METLWAGSSIVLCLAQDLPSHVDDLGVLSLVLVLQPSALTASCLYHNEPLLASWIASNTSRAHNRFDVSPHATPLANLSNREQFKILSRQHGGLCQRHLLNLRRKYIKRQTLRETLPLFARHARLRSWIDEAREEHAKSARLTSLFITQTRYLAGS